MGMVIVALLAFVLGKSVLDDEILSLDPLKLAHLLPERLHEDRATRSIAWIEETYAKDFPCLLRLGWKAKRQEHGAKREANEFFSHEFTPPAVAIACRLLSKTAPRALESETEIKCSA